MAFYCYYFFFHIHRKMVTFYCHILCAVFKVIDFLLVVLKYSRQCS